MNILDNLEHLEDENSLLNNKSIKALKDKQNIFIGLAVFYVFLILQTLYQYSYTLESYLDLFTQLSFSYIFLITDALLVYFYVKNAQKTKQLLLKKDTLCMEEYVAMQTHTFKVYTVSLVLMGITLLKNNLL